MNFVQTTFPELETERLRLICPAHPEFDAFDAFLSPAARPFIDQYPNDEAVWWSMATIIGHWHLRGYGHFAVIRKDTGAHCGLVGPWYPRGWPEPELSWQLMEGAEGQGIASEAARGVLDWLFSEKGWSTCVSLVDDENLRSISMVERLGARPEGIFSHQLTGDLRIWRHMPATFAGRKLMKSFA